MKMKYTEQAVETLDDAGGVIANKNIEIEQLRQRVQELKKERDALLEANRIACEDLVERHNRIAELRQQRDELMAAIEKLTDVLANIGITSGLYDNEQDALKAACDAIASVKEKS